MAWLGRLSHLGPSGTKPLLNLHSCMISTCGWVAGLAWLALPSQAGLACPAQLGWLAGLARLGALHAEHCLIS